MKYKKYPPPKYQNKDKFIVNMCKQSFILQIQYSKMSDNRRRKLSYVLTFTYILVSPACMYALFFLKKNRLCVTYIEVFVHRFLYVLKKYI